MYLAYWYFVSLHPGPSFGGTKQAVRMEQGCPADNTGAQGGRGRCKIWKPEFPLLIFGSAVSNMYGARDPWKPLCSKLPKLSTARFALAQPTCFQFAGPGFTSPKEHTRPETAAHFSTAEHFSTSPASPPCQQEGQGGAGIGIQGSSRAWSVGGGLVGSRRTDWKVWKMANFWIALPNCVCTLRRFRCKYNWSNAHAKAVGVGEPEMSYLTSLAR